MNDHALERLAERLNELEERVHTLEHPLAANTSHPSTEAEEIFEPSVGATVPVAQSGGMFPVLGRAMLGIAGAYVLRALAETGSLPRLVVASAGIVYALLWLVWATRAHRGPRFASSIYASTSALILAPMLWELTLRFKILPTSSAAGIVCAFALVAIALAAFAKSPTNDIVPVLRVACIASAGLALALAIASHTALPFIAVLLILAALYEFVPRLERIADVRAGVALAADIAIWILIYTYFSQQIAHDDYPLHGESALLAPSILVFLIFTASVCTKTVWRGKQITVFETVQTTVAFLLAAVSLVDFGPLKSTALLGILCMVFSAVGYTLVFTVFDRTAGRRNAAVFAAWSATLLLGGCLLSLAPQWIAAGLSIAAVASTWVGGRRGRFAFKLYGIVFLLTAASASALPGFLFNAFVGTPAGPPSLSIWIVAACAILCYLSVKSLATESWILQVVHIALAALATGAVAALFVEGLVATIYLIVIPGAHHLAFTRTLALCVAALVLAFGGAHWCRLELTRLGYATLALVAVKLLVEDLRHGHLEYIAGSIFLFALTLIAVPRVARAKNKPLEA